MELAAVRTPGSNEVVLSGPGNGASGARAHGPLKITDPVAFQKMLADMKVKAEEQRVLAAKREAERAKREGDGYQPAAAETIKAKNPDEGGTTTHKIDAQRDYYATLAVESCASAAEIKAAYKKLALLYHPDKHKAVDAEQQAAVADKFREAAEAFEILSNETTRALYDKVRDYQGANPGRGLPVLSREEAAMMASGAAELARLRRLGAKHVKHGPTQRSVTLSMEALNSGCMKTVTLTRRRVDEHGIEYDATRNYYLVIRKGSRQGDVITFEGDGDETVDTKPGDLCITLQAEPHPKFRRAGDKDLEVFCGSLPRFQFFSTAEVPLPTGGATRLLCMAVLPRLLAGGGAGGVCTVELPGAGLFDHDDPWRAPAGVLRASMRYPALKLEDATWRAVPRLGPLYLVGMSELDLTSVALSGPTSATPASSSGTPDTLSLALVGGCLGRDARNRRQALELEQHCSGSEEPSQIVVVLLSKLQLQSGFSPATNPSLAALVAGLRCTSPGLAPVVTFVEGEPLLDDEHVALQRADAIVLLDVVDATGPASVPGSDPGNFACASELAYLLRLATCRGAAVAAGGTRGMALLRTAGLLPWYQVRPGETDGGWRTARVAAAAHPDVTCVGVPAGALYAVDQATGRGAVLVAAPPAALHAAAVWEPTADEVQAVAESPLDFGFLIALTAEEESPFF